MKTILIAALLGSAITPLAAPALADPPADQGGNGQGNQGCGLGNGGPVDPGQCTNNGGNGGNGGQGGNGGAGGAGGTGIGIGIGTGGDATATGGNATATGGNASQSQGQQQGQAQGQQQSIGDTSAAASSSATGGTSSSSAQGGAGGASNATGGSSGGNVISVGGDHFNYKRNAPGSSAPAVFVGNCQMSTSVGLSSVLGGVSAGWSRGDKFCQTMQVVDRLEKWGLVPAACQLLALDRKVAEAMRRAGAGCPAYPVAH